jgi:K+-transporting ATPase ATPase A chain
VSIAQGHGHSGGNMSDKEVCFGIAGTALFATATTASSDGAVNRGFGAFIPAGGAVPLLNVFVGEMIFGGVGSGLYSMLFVIVLAGFGGTSFTASVGAMAMTLGRFVPLIAALALVGSLARKRTVVASVGALRTDGPTFATLLVGMIVLTSGLMILPALTLGPVVEGLAH